jgi:hypothetical protein
MQVVTFADSQTETATTSMYSCPIPICQPRQLSLYFEYRRLRLAKRQDRHGSQLQNFTDVLLQLTANLSILPCRHQLKLSSHYLHGK